MNTTPSNILSFYVYINIDNVTKRGDLNLVFNEMHISLHPHFMTGNTPIPVVVTGKLGMEVGYAQSY